MEQYKQETTSLISDLKDAFSAMNKDVSLVLHPFTQTSTLQHLRPANPIPVVNAHGLERPAVV